MNELDLINRMNRGISYIGIAIAIVAFFFTIPFFIKDINSVSGMSGSYFYLNITISRDLAYVLMAAGIIMVIASFLPFFYSNTKFSSFDVKNNAYYFSAVSVYLAVLVFSSVIIEIFDPSIAASPVSHMPLGKQNFIYLMSSIFQVLIFEFIPITVLLAIILLATKNFKLASFFNPYSKVKGYTVIFMLVPAAVAVLITNYNLYDSVLIYLSTLVLSFIYIRYGLLRSVLASFMSSFIEFSITAFKNNVVIALIVSIFIFIWAFAGLYTATFYLVDRNRKVIKNTENIDNEQNERIDPAKKIQERIKTPPDELWIRSACPNCGNIEFKINADMSMECTKCGQKLDRDYTGPYNIIINNAIGRRQP
jgi:ribosomal protein S27E